MTKVLIIDYDAGSRKEVANIFAGLGCETRDVTSEEALGVYMAWHPGVVVVNHGTEETSAKQVAQQMRGYAASEGLRTFMALLSGSEGTQLGPFDAVYRKPFDTRTAKNLISCREDGDKK